ncbi:hypothetical protein [Algoriphagus sp. AK58]|uniref:hypothetical protein n=1 Tax=Algoriphagus sp. AK58 TaxID=1406877 RepID=UPI00165020F0|nr:hypothetical protein [Algoriphagus sp. AK58]MBC6368422.1 hypothetical protein [Algoriphagus sp. AK58]
MKKLLFLILALSISCTEKKEVKHGDFLDFVTAEMSFERDQTTGFIGFSGTVLHQGKESIVSEWNGIFQFFDPETGRKIDQFEIPSGGPMALKGGYHIGKAFDGPQFIATNNTGNTNFYENDTLVKGIQLDMAGYEPKGFLNFPDSRNALQKLSENEFEITFDPFNIMSFQTETDGLDLEFGSWIGKFDSEGKWICRTDFKAPYDATFANSTMAGRLVRMVENENSWAMFPYSDSLYQIKDCKIIKRIKLESHTPIQYFPEKFIINGRSRYWERPENGALNTHLIHDPKNRLYVRFTILEQIKTQPEIKDPRQRMYLNKNKYLLLIYDQNWNLLAELTTTFDLGTRFENLIVSNGYLLINKPEQKSEDEYEFYKIDMSQFRN